MVNFFIFFACREKPNDSEWLELRASKIPLLLNFSQCRLAVNDYYPVIEFCTEVLEADPGTSWDTYNSSVLIEIIYIFKGKIHPMGCLAESQLE